MSQTPPPNDNPYASPQAPGDFPPNSEAARQRVGGPALALMIFAGIGVGLQAISILFDRLWAGVGAAVAEDQQQQALQLMSGGMVLVFGAIGLAVGGLIFYGATQMRNLQNWGLSMAASVLAIVPCVSPCCLLGLPIGIWCLVVLNDAQVKRSFIS